MEVKNLLKTLAVQSASYKNEMMMAYIKSKLDRMGIANFFDTTGNLYGTKGVVDEGDCYPCVVAHTDTVHKIHDQYSIFNVGGYAVAFSGPNQVGTGGDDKVGIHMALELLRDFPQLKVAFFVDEEVGCKGSRSHFHDFFKDVGYILQADRRGNEDIIWEIGNKELCSPEFKTAIAPQVELYKRKWTGGATTDVGALADIHKISMMNMSCGYYLPHTDKEYVSIEDVNNTYMFMRDIIANLGNKVYSCEHKSSYVVPVRHTPVEADYDYDTHHFPSGYMVKGVYMDGKSVWVNFKFAKWSEEERGYVLKEGVKLEDLKKKSQATTLIGTGTQLNNTITTGIEEEEEELSDAQLNANWQDVIDRLERKAGDEVPLCFWCGSNKEVEFDDTHGKSQYFCWTCNDFFEKDQVPPSKEKIALLPTVRPSLFTDTDSATYTIEDRQWVKQTKDAIFKMNKDQTAWRIVAVWSKENKMYMPLDGEYESKSVISAANKIEIAKAAMLALPKGDTGGTFGWEKGFYTRKDYDKKGSRQHWLIHQKCWITLADLKEPKEAETISHFIPNKKYKDGAKVLHQGHIYEWDELAINARGSAGDWIDLGIYTPSGKTSKTK